MKEVRHEDAEEFARIAAQLEHELAKTRAVNRWRDSFNPLRSINISRIVALRESYDLGQFTDLMWTYRAIERSDADLIALLERRAAALLEMGCSPVAPSDAVLREVERDRCAPEDFYSTTNHRTYVRHGQQWIEVENQRMDAMIVVRDGQACCRRLRDLGFDGVAFFQRPPQLS